MKTLITAGLAALAMTGCAYKAQTVNISPPINVAPSSVGAGIQVQVSVVDERASKSLGRRGNAYGAAAEITAAGDMTQIVRERVIEGLTRKGFVVTDQPAAGGPRLEVEIRLLEYGTSQGFWTGGVQIQSTLKADAENRGERFEKIFRSDREERVAVVPTAEKNAEWINRALGESLDQMLNDADLTAFLGKK
jgi:uncharacterized lipoprotein YajG